MQKENHCRQRINIVSMAFADTTTSYLSPRTFHPVVFMAPLSLARLALETIFVCT